MDYNNFYKTILEIIHLSDKPVPLHVPTLSHEDISIVTKTIESGWVSYQGEMVKKFEEELARYLGVPNVIAVVNGTTALFAVLKGLEVGYGTEVLLPSLTFAATANAVVHAGAIPHFVDSQFDSFNIDCDKLEAYLDANTYLNNKGILINKKTENPITSIIPVHVLGSACDLKKLSSIAEKFSLRIIEDAAEALGSNYHDKKVSATTGTGILSFNGNKVITTGGGGAIVTHNDVLAKKIRHLTTTAKKAHRYEFEHDEIGYNLRLPALNAALGYSQLLKLDSYILKKRKLYQIYKEKFINCNFGKMFNPDSFGSSNCWLNAFVLNEDQKENKNNFLEYLNNRDIFVRPFWKPLHTLEIYKDFPRSDCTIAQELYDRVICLPSSPSLVADA